MSSMWIFIFVWGIWILIPIVVDGVGTILKLIIVLLYGRNFKPHEIMNAELPKVSIIIPARNEEKIIDRCINSLKIQDYPHEKIEIIVVDDGSIDKTPQIVNNHVNGNGNIIWTFGEVF